MAAMSAAAARATSNVVFEHCPNSSLAIRLNRPDALNALDEEMTSEIRRSLADDRARACLISSTSNRALCAGGDIKALRAALLEDPYSGLHPPPGHKVHRVFAEEYSLVAEVGARAGPTVSLVEGVWMGFGVGATVFGSHRVVTDQVTFAMPENFIGLWPDVGFALAAARCPGALGLYVGLTGARLTSPRDLLHAGLATHYVPAPRWQALQEALQQEELGAGPAARSAVDALLGRFAEEAPARGCLEAEQALVEQLYGPALEYRQRGLGLGQALHELQGHLESAQADGLLGEAGQQLVRQAVAAMQSCCPFSQALTLAHYSAVAADVKAGGPLGRLDAVMEREYRMAVRAASRPDFVEGVRAVVVDKDRRAAWQQQGWGEVRDAEVEALLGPLPGGERLALGGQQPRGGP